MKLAKKVIATVAAGALIVAIFGLAGCGSNSSSSSSSANSSSSAAAAIAEKVKIGTMPNEHILPMWVAESEGLFANAGIEAEVISFDSAQALSAAITAGEVDLAMTDVMRSVKLTEAGTPVDLEWITLGADSSQGRFGVMAPADAPYSTLKELAEYAKGEPAFKGVGVAANTVPEYVFDKLCEREGLAIGEIPTQEVASLPERFSLMSTGNLTAAALPGSLLALGESKGMKVLADSTKGDTISISVMVATEKFGKENAGLIDKVAQVWDEGVDLILKDKTAYGALLAEKANLNSDIADDYPIDDYPYALANGKLAHPASSLVDPVIEWMKAKGYTEKSVTYDAQTGAIAVS